MSEKRWISRSIVNMLIREDKDYKAAAKVVSGSSDVFSMCSRKIAEELEQIEEHPAAASALALQLALNEATAEIEDHQEWHELVFKGLPKEDDESGLTGLLRQEFTRTAQDREKLREEVKAAHQKYFSDQTEASTLDG